MRKRNAERKAESEKMDEKHSKFCFLKFVGQGE